MNEITIEGLTHKQKALMDVMWSMDDIGRVRAFVTSLPHRDRLDCLSLMDIALHESLELEGALDAYENDAQAVIASASS